MSRQLQQLRDAIEAILEADEVQAHKDGSFTVNPPDGTPVMVRQQERGDWAAHRPGGQLVPFSPTGSRPHEVIVWALA